MTTNELEQVEQMEQIQQAFPYEVLAGSPKEIFLTYVVVLLACTVVYPVVSLMVSTISKGLARWW